MDCIYTYCTKYALLEYYRKIYSQNSAVAFCFTSVFMNSSVSRISYSEVKVRTEKKVIGEPSSAVPRKSRIYRDDLTVVNVDI